MSIEHIKHDVYRVSDGLYFRYFDMSGYRILAFNYDEEVSQSGKYSVDVLLRNDDDNKEDITFCLWYKNKEDFHAGVSSFLKLMTSQRE